MIYPAGNELNLLTLRFLNACQQAQFDTGDHVHFRITLEMPGWFITHISDDGGQTFMAIVDQKGILQYRTFAEALNAIIEHKREM